MPSPIGHELAGVLVYDIVERVSSIKRNTKALFLCLFVALLPDFDFVPGILAGEPNRYHHGLSHSMFIGLLVSAIIALLFFSQERWYVFIPLFFAVYLSHLLLDLIAVDRSYPFGLQLLWPVSSDYFLSPKVLFSDIRRANSSSDFFTSLIFEHHNYVSVLRELVLLLPPVVAFRIYNRLGARSE